MHDLNGSDCDGHERPGLPAGAETRRREDLSVLLKWCYSQWLLPDGLGLDSGHRVRSCQLHQLWVFPVGIQGHDGHTATN